MKKIIIVILLLIIALPGIAFMFDLTTDFLAQQRLAQDPIVIESKQPIEEADLEKLYGARLDYNLGDLKDKMSSDERITCLNLIAAIDEHVTLRSKRHYATFYPQEYEARQAFNRRLDELTEQYFTIPEWEDAPTDVTEKSNKTRIFDSLRAVMKPNDYEQFVTDYDAYVDDPTNENYNKVFEQLDLYSELNSGLIVLLLDQYSLEESKALFAIDDKLNLKTTPIVTDDYQAVSGSLADEDKWLIWSLIKKIITAQDLKKFDYLLVSSDGEYFNLASMVVSPNDDGSGERWLIQIDDADLADDLMGTLVHEYAHYLTLNEQQVEYTNDFSVDLYCEEGLIARKDSLLTDFYLRFWQEFIIDDAYETSYHFYLRNSSAFVSDYAATNASEDIAETFRVFVLEDKPTDNSVAAQKVMFFYERPRYVELRNTIRQNLDLD